MNDILRQEIATAAHTIVIKVGTRVLTNQDGTLDMTQIAWLSEEIHRLMEIGRKVVLVSSGAVGAGMSQLALERRPTDLAQLQAVAAVGQTKLIEAYDGRLRAHGRHAAQLLLIADDLDDRTRYLNVRNTLLALLKLKAVPIVNENDTVAVDELMTTFGDNDRLAAMVTSLLRAPLLIILSDVEGLYDGDPNDGNSKLVSTITHLDDRVIAYAKDHQTGLSKGGMASKLEAARLATTAGENVIIACGHQRHVLRDIIAGRPVGTLILAQGKSIRPWKRWIGLTAQPRGRIVLDAGAHLAIQQQGRSLLPIGIVSVEGTFKKGDVVSLCRPTGQEFARGLTNYPATEVQRIAGHRSEQIAEILGHHPYDEVIHRDNMSVTPS
jgi:glutamate 5-kinase